MKITVTVRYSKRIDYTPPCEAHVTLVTDATFNSMGYISDCSHSQTLHAKDFQSVETAVRDWIGEKVELTKKAYTLYSALVPPPERIETYDVEECK